MIQEDEYLNYIIIITSLNKIIEHYSSQQTVNLKTWSEYFEFVQSINDIGNLLQDFVLLCSEESNLNVGWLVHTVLLDCDTHPSLLVCCYVIHRMTVRKLLLHG